MERRRRKKEKGKEEENIWKEVREREEKEEDKSEYWGRMQLTDMPSQPQSATRAQFADARMKPLALRMRFH